MGKMYENCIWIPAQTRHQFYPKALIEANVLPQAEVDGGLCKCFCALPTSETGMGSWNYVLHITDLFRLLSAHAPICLHYKQKGLFKCFRIYKIYTYNIYIYMCSVYIYVYKSSIDFICVSLVYNHIDRERERATNCQRGPRLVRKESRFQDVFRSCDVHRRATSSGAMRRMANRHDRWKR